VVTREEFPLSQAWKSSERNIAVIGTEYRALPVLNMRDNGVQVILVQAGFKARLGRDVADGGFPEKRFSLLRKQLKKPPSFSIWFLMPPSAPSGRFSNPASNRAMPSISPMVSPSPTRTTQGLFLPLMWM
jgi:hypothetical protein